MTKSTPYKCLQEIGQGDDDDDVQDERLDSVTLTLTMKRTMTIDSGEEAIKMLERRIPVFCNGKQLMLDRGTE